MKAIWNTIELLLKDSPDVLATLGAAADSVQIDKTTQVLGLKLPKALESSLLIHNGQTSDLWPLYDHWKLLSLDQIATIGVELRQRLGCDLIPITSNGAGDFQCIDASTGVRSAPVVLIDHESMERLQVAVDYSSWLEDVAEQLRIKLSVMRVSTNIAPDPPSMENLVRLIGLSVEDPEARAILANRNTKGDDDPDTGPALINKADGFEIQLGRKGRIEVIHIYGISKDGFSPYPGALSGGLTLADGFQTVRERFGSPTRTGIRDGNAGGWDRFDSKQVCIRFGYRAEGTGIGLVTLMAPDVAP